MSEFLATLCSIDNQQTHGESVFPLAYVAAGGGTLDDASAWVNGHREQLLAEATRHGAVLLRNFPAATPEDFDRLIASLNVANFPYEESLSNAVRVNRTQRVFTANEAPSEVTIYLHHEMAQTPIFPGHIFFFCQRPADAGGATPICRSDVLLERLKQKEPQFVADCIAKGLRYTNVMPPGDDRASGMGRSWQSTLAVEDQTQAENRLAELGYSGEWMDDGCLRATTPVLAAVREIAPGRQTFFNQLIAAFKGWKDTRNDPSKSICHGDFSPLDSDAVLTAAEIADELTFDLAWQQGDVAILDNFVAMHGRRTFRGQRQILASLATAHRAHTADSETTGSSIH